MNEFEFNLAQTVRLVDSTETGTVIARAEYLHGENQFLVLTDPRRIAAAYAQGRLFA